MVNKHIALLKLVEATRVELFNILNKESIKILMGMLIKKDDF